MATHSFAPTRFYNSIGSHEPVLVVGDGDTVVTETLDAHGFDREGRKRAEGPNPMTGPFYVSGTAPGDALLIRIDRISMTRSTGWTFQVLSPNVVNPSAIARFPGRQITDWIIDIATERARPTKPPAALRDWSVAVKPMIGCFGVAPAMGQSISTATSGPYGGNMDYRGFGAGVEVMFPVSVPGGLFFLGDVHAAQGDGEIVGTGIETAAEVQFTVQVVKKKPISWPRGSNTSEIFTIGNARPLDQALQHATTEMLDWLIQDYGLDEVSASHVMGQAVCYDIANVFNPAYSIVCRIGREWLTSLRQG
ncbi:MAG TPA: acetamidase/formamidase family protein [Aestuariivirga sp.]|nr:acetamidase/formamidase family protein [Aestuariivirga sp.]